MYKIIWLISILFILLNTFSLNAFYNNYVWKIKYENKLYDESIKYFDKAWNIEWVYNKWNSYYKQKKYIDAIKEYKSILNDKKNNLNFRLNHNIANTLYRIWEWQKESNIKLKAWEESIKYYIDALNINFDKQTKENLDFVLKKIKEEKQKKDDKKDKKWDTKQDWKKWDNSEKNKNQKNWDKNKESNSWELKNEEDWNSSTNSWENKQNDKNNETKVNKQENSISDRQEAEIQKYKEYLKQEQLQNAWDFNKVYKENNLNDPFDDIFNDPFFNNSLLNTWWNDVKDW